MKELGSYFRSKREEQGITLEEVARETNITHRQLEAIENQEFDRFPADVYAKGFIRTYAEYLDLDAQDLVMEYSLTFEDNGGEPEPTEDNRGIGYWALLAILVVSGALMIFLRFAWIHPRDVQHLNQSHAPPRSAPLGERADARFELPVSENPDKLTVDLVATGKTWVYAVFDGMRKREFMFQPGDETTWTVDDTIRLRLGNAGGIRLYYRGKPLPPLGEPGEVADKIITLQDGILKIKSVGGER